VTTCEVDFRVRVESPSAQPNDPLFPKQWNMAAIKAPGAWAAGQLGGPLGGPQGQVRPAPALPLARRPPLCGAWAERSTGAATNGAVGCPRCASAWWTPART